MRADSEVVVGVAYWTDDYLSIEFCESVQQEAVDQLKDNNDERSLDRGLYRNYHVGQQYSPWNDTMSRVPLWVWRKKCVHAGLTFSYGGTLVQTRYSIPGAQQDPCADTCCSDGKQRNACIRIALSDEMMLLRSERGPLHRLAGNELFCFWRRPVGPWEVKGLLKKVTRSQWRKDAE
jgi:hypothetical protein